ncbi:FAD binding domain-containing protein [Polyplosphaeria fusca]|uniref:FAD binding domain-containing protein n=1 Tax=Polyplosphaeria fusca TaxID=682080 RepID=A0A9P4RCJ5_9PLEO|nr:FAD binding domain-containing protein [Polyplosphaeria fusca]
MRPQLLSSLVFAFGISSILADSHPKDVAARLSKELIPQLSKGASISSEGPPRWSTFKAPKPAVVVNVACENDVSITVKYLGFADIPFLAQNGGNGWATTFDLGKNGVLINLAQLNKFVVSADKKQATIGGGIHINDTIAAADAAGVIVQTGNCNCLGTLGAYLGGGYGNTLGFLSFGIDNIVSLKVVLASGKMVTASASSNPDLFWAMKGAGPNFGIVTSAVIKAFPTTPAERSAWAGALIYSADKLERVVQAVEELVLKPHMVIYIYFVSQGPPTNAPMLMVTPFLYKGNAEAGKAAFASLYQIGPDVDTTTIVPYTSWNTGGDGFCTRGGRKPSYSVGMMKLVPSTWRKVWNLYTEFQKKPGAENSAILMESYSLGTAKSIPGSSASFPNRAVNYNSIVIAWYNDSALDKAAQAFGIAVRNAWRADDGLSKNNTYINFAHGDEPIEDVYGDSLQRLKKVKRRYDPDGKFDQWFDLS